MITRELIEKGIDNDIVKIRPYWDIDEKSRSTEPICRIGEYWFYFAGRKGEDGYVNYLIEHSKDEIVRQIFEAMEELDETERYYYEYYILEHLNDKEESE